MLGLGNCDIQNYFVHLNGFTVLTEILKLLLLSEACSNETKKVFKKIGPTPLKGENHLCRIGKQDMKQDYTNKLCVNVCAIHFVTGKTNKTIWNTIMIIHILLCSNPITMVKEVRMHNKLHFVHVSLNFFHFFSRS